jgi:hypothetical protein
MTFDDFRALVELVMSPKFTMAAAEKRLGRVKTWISPGRGDVASSDPELYNTLIEVLVPEVRGKALVATFTPVVLVVQTQPTKPLIATWDQMKKAFGPAKEGEPVLDAVGGPTPYSFKCDFNGTKGDLALHVQETAGKSPVVVDINIYRRPPT